MVKHGRWPLRQPDNLVVECLQVIDEGGVLTKILYCLHSSISDFSIITEKCVKWVLGFDGRDCRIEVNRIIEDLINRFR